MSNREGNLNDYLGASFVALPLALIVTLISGGAAGNWGVFIAVVIVGGLFLNIPAGWTAAYLNFRFHQMGENIKMSGLSAGFFTAFVFTVITLILAIVGAIANTANAAPTFIGWILNVVFAFIFITLGGYIAGSFEESSWAMPGFFNLAKAQRSPPPPPLAAAANVQNCPTCGRPMRFVEQYNRWYCDHDKKYA